MKKLISISALILSMILVVCGCGNESTGKKEKNTKENKFAGTWVATIDLTDKIQEEIYDEELADYLNLEGLTFDLVIKFDEDGTYETYADEESLEGFVDNLCDSLKEALTDYLNDAIKESGQNTTVDELLKAQDTTMDELIDSLREEMDIDEITGSFKKEGKWEADSKKLYLSDSLSNDVDHDVYEEYELSKKELTITGSSEDDDDDLYDFFPITFYKK